MLEVRLEGELENFGYNFGFSAASGITAIWGKSGAGKTTLLRMIAGLIHPSSGKVTFSDKNWFDDSRRINVTPADRQTGYVPQNSMLFPHLKVRSNLTYSNWAARRRTGLDIEELSKLLDISHLMDRYPRNLSGGEGKRVAIGRAMMSRPEILLLDEPFSGLDEQRIGDVASHIRTLNRQYKVPVLLVTHSVRDVVRLADSMIVIDNGKTVDTGTVENILPGLGITSGDPPFGQESILSGKVIGYDKSYGLNQLDVAGQSLVVSGGQIPVGTMVRILVNASEVLVATDPKIRTSARNHLACRVSAITQLPDNRVHLQLVCGDQKIRAEITNKALDDLSLKKKSNCTAILKSVSLANQVFPR